jgi:hypothetical protein
MNTPPNNRFTKRYKIINIGVIGRSANDESVLIIDPTIPLSAAEKSALRSNFDTLAPVIAINKKVFISRSSTSYQIE